jgi:putative colanic acid biosynthesis acetyltransferase WcaF
MSGEAALTRRAPLLRRRPPSVSNKVARVFWNVARVFLFRPTPTPMHAWRRLLLRAFGARVGSRAGVYPTAVIWAPWNLSVDAGATIGGGVVIYNVDQVAIGRHAIISQGAQLCTASHDYNSPGFDLVTAPIRIGDEAWVAADAFVGPGVTVARAAVIGARAVVVKNIGERAIVAGNPARVIGARRIEGRNYLKGRTPSGDPTGPFQEIDAPADEVALH